MKMENQKSIQNEILTQTKKDNKVVTVILINGARLYGKVSAFDNYVLLLEVKGRQQLIYKHAISTIIPDSDNSEK
ncbi:RNA chaperone Hfq [Bacillus spizizenii]|nr:MULTISPECIES: RNA chaperone Hfq [Bacillus subtilis group]MEC2189674.1 RNA chaperone Hfq [Bacillus spizizenii]MEC2297045.1 RNA chaperone Hfq [Bacillus subtilis]MEC2403632.1 RNA chaperone Hfq [Bacillus subtilis]MED4660913.1 RNA chaperone Hfq [Bacillus subtilis]MED4667491.1 RNA chaperone Hfq [Bacillus subtilis]